MTDDTIMTERTARTYHKYHSRQQSSGYEEKSHDRERTGSARYSARTAHTGKRSDRGRAAASAQPSARTAHAGERPGRERSAAAQYSTRTARTGERPVRTRPEGAYSNRSRYSRAGIEQERRRLAVMRARRLKRKRTKRIISRVAVAVTVILVALFVLFEIFPVYSTVKAEVGTSVGLDDFLRFHYNNSSFEDGSADYDVNKVGEYDVKVKAGIFSHKSKLIITDSTPPDVEVHDLIIGVNDKCNADEFISDVKDSSETTARFKTEPDLSRKDSRQNVTIAVEDEGGNVTEKQAGLWILPINYHIKLETGSAPAGIWNFVPGMAEETEDTRVITDVNSLDYNIAGAVYDVEVMYYGNTYPAIIEIEDTIPPEFTYSEDFTAYIGESIRYKDHVSVSDNSGYYELDIDTSKVRQDEEGVYDVKYTATDGRGNSASVTVKVTVTRKTASEQELFDYVDNVLAELLTDDMNTEQKAWAIYEYVRGHVTFINYSDKGDYVLAATQALREAQGDCYAFFSVAKVMLDRAGIKNFDIQVHTDENEHYWNVVDIGDGHGWYHFDTTPTVDARTIFLCTDEELIAGDDGRWNYDRNAYPHIP